MPIPKRQKDEPVGDFMDRCMSDPVMRSEFPDADQRAAVCHQRAEMRAMRVNYRIVAQGRGGTVFVETAIAVAQKGVLVNGPQRSVFTVQQVTELAQNYQRWIDEGGAPLPGYFGHAQTAEIQQRRDQGLEDPALLVHKLWQEGDALMARLEFMPWAWNKVWADGAMPYRGVSIVWNPNGKDRNGKQIGAVFGGVDIVPEPFLPVQIAAARLEEWSIGRVDATHACFAALDKTDELVRLTFKSLPTEEKKMSDENKNLEHLLGRIKDLEAKVETVKTDNTKLVEQHKTEMAALEARAKKAEDEATGLKKEIAKQSTLTAGKQAKEAIELALEKGLINVADVAGYDKGSAEAMAVFEKLGWFKTPEAMLEFCKNHMDGKTTKTTKGVRMSSGTGKPTDDSDTGDDDGQSEYLAKVEEHYAAAKKDNPQASYEDSLRFAAQKHPKEYQKYLSAVDREK